MLAGHGVEGRYPYLDHRVASFAARLPDSAKLCGLNDKLVLRRAAARAPPRKRELASEAPLPGPDRVGSRRRGSAAVGRRAVAALACRRHAACWTSRSWSGLPARAGKEHGRGLGEIDAMALTAALSIVILHERSRGEPTGAALDRADESRSADGTGTGMSDGLPTPFLLQDRLRDVETAYPRPRRRPHGVRRRTRTATCSQRATRFARCLQDAGVQRGDRVVLQLENSWDCACAVYGTFLAGGVVTAVSVHTAPEKLCSSSRTATHEPLVAESRLVDALRRVGRRAAAVCSCCSPEGSRTMPTRLARSELSRRGALDPRGAADSLRPGRSDLHLGQHGLAEGGHGHARQHDLHGGEHLPVPAARGVGPPARLSPIRLRVRALPASRRGPHRGVRGRSSPRSRSLPVSPSEPMPQA